MMFFILYFSRVTYEQKLEKKISVQSCKYWAYILNCTYFSINQVRKIFWVVKHNLAAGVQPILLKPRAFRSHKHLFCIFFNSGHRYCCKMLAYFHQFFTCLINELVSKTLTSAASFEHIVASLISKGSNLIVRYYIQRLIILI